ncbi:MAG: HPr family phosphocarrier protein [Clostridia bacterium]|nr:HPr family phosphocarrier protein [Clostridia bacterium]
MKEFVYKIKDEIGIHARPAGLLVKEAAKYKSAITIEKDGKSTEATKLFGVMGLGVKCGEEVCVKIEGEDEEVAAKAMRDFFETTL